jgi:hypothetical protein
VHDRAPSRWPAGRPARRRAAPGAARFGGRRPCRAAASARRCSTVRSAGSAPSGDSGSLR